MKTLTTQEFKNKLEFKEKFIVDFFAEWCGPCSVLWPIVESASLKFEQSGSKVNVYKYNIEEDREFALELGVRSIPTIKAFKNGEQVKNTVGVVQENVILQMAGELL